jgi:hypothetical protein
MATSGINLSNAIIKGQNHYKGNIVSLFEAHAAGFAQELEIDGILEPEPTNGHDPNAVVLKVRATPWDTSLISTQVISKRKSAAV